MTVTASTSVSKDPAQVIAKVGIIGCGNISSIYLQNLQQAACLQLVAVSDVDMGRAQAQADAYGIRAMPVADLLASEVDIIVNLTTPQAHVPVSRQIIDAGKSVYSEKPLGLRHAEVQTLLARANDQGVLVGCAPDTFLGAGLQTCRRLIDAGDIGEPLAASGFMLCPGHESWHPDPAFYYQQGGGPLFDMGPYYLTALVHLLGSIHSVSGAARITRKTRTITSEPKRGEQIKVETPTHIIGLLEFTRGLHASLTTSFDVTASNFSNIEIYGSEGTLSVPDPNTFAGPVRVRTQRGDWQEIPLDMGYADNSRGLGVADMAWALHEKRQQRASGELAGHVLEAMEKILLAAQEKRWLTLESHATQPEPLTNPAETWFHLRHVAVAAPLRPDTLFGSPQDIHD